MCIYRERNTVKETCNNNGIYLVMSPYSTASFLVHFYNLEAKCLLFKDAFNSFAMIMVFVSVLGVHHICNLPNLK